MRREWLSQLWVPPTTPSPLLHPKILTRRSESHTQSPNPERAGPNRSTTSSSKLYSSLIVIGRKLRHLLVQRQLFRSKSSEFLQIRSHAQKYFLKVQKNGTSEHVPPPRPKRKASHPYPQKASKNALLPSQAMPPFQSSSFVLEPGYNVRTDSMLMNSTTSAVMSSWTHNSVIPLSVSHVTKDDIGPVGPTVANNCCCSSTGSPPRTWPSCETTDQGNHAAPNRVMPDFAEVYNFIGSVFDPNTSGHLQKLKEMDPIDVETILLLMRNLSVNLSSPDFEDHRRLLSSYDVESEEAKPCSTHKSNDADEPKKAVSRANGKGH